LLPQLP